VVTVNNKAPRSALTPQERAFCELVADFTDGRSVETKARECGWKADKYGYKLYRRPVIAAEIERLERENLSMLRNRRARIIQLVCNEAENATLTADRLKAAELVLKWLGDIGTGGNVTHVNVNNKSADERDLEFAEHLRELRNRNGNRAAQETE
jgi:hypothetical protein